MSLDLEQLDRRHAVLRQVEAPEQPLMALPQIELGPRFTALGPLERLAVVTAATEGQINHSRLRELSTEHSADITKMLGRLVRDGLLGAEGIGRGKVYFLSSQHFPCRDLADLRKRILNPLVKEALLLRAYPNPNDPRQAYMTVPRSPPPSTESLNPDQP